jgi:hypothetical protein
VALTRRLRQLDAEAMRLQSSCQPGRAQVLRIQASEIATQIENLKTAIIANERRR